ncbi:MAG: SH3 domain-containing protein [Cytophagales bacterium]|nr:SH3 domain-containing protein [Cytophagales bacterium]
MQNLRAKLFTIFLFTIITFSYLSAQDLKQLYIADSLFEAKKYNEAYQIYYTNYTQYQFYTPQTLLKMAYIQEGLSNNIKALYFLNEFYEKFPDKAVFNKMKEIASHDKLEGYVYSDFEFFSNTYRTYQNQILIGICIFMFLYFLAVAANKIFIKGLSNSSLIFYILILSAIFYVINFGDKYITPPRKVVLKDKCLVMSAPSAGAKVHGVLHKGDRIIITDKVDIWARIELKGVSGYVRESNLTM